MKPESTVSPSGERLVVTEYGTGFLHPTTRELRKAFGVHVAPEPKSVRPATAEEAAAFFNHERAISNELRAYYDRRGAYTGD